MTQKHQIFISYSRENTDKKDQIVADLIDFGFSVWVDSINIPYGSAWLEKIQEGIKNSKVLLYLGSKDAMVSPNVGFELGFAMCCETIIIPTLIKGNNISEGIPDWLRAKQSATTLRGVGQYEQNKSEFFSSILSMIHDEVTTQMSEFVSPYAKLEELLATLNGVSGEGDELYDDYLEQEKKTLWTKKTLHFIIPILQ